MVRQFIENGRTETPWSLFKKVCSMIGILQSIGVSSDMFMDVLFAVELVLISLNEKKGS